MACCNYRTGRPYTLSMKRIIVTGGSGKAGRAVVADLLEHGYDVLNLDIRRRKRRRPHSSA